MDNFTRIEGMNIVAPKTLVRRSSAPARLIVGDSLLLTPRSSLPGKDGPKSYAETAWSSCSSMIRSLTLPDVIECRSPLKIADRGIGLVVFSSTSENGKQHEQEKKRQQKIERMNRAAEFDALLDGL